MPDPNTQELDLRLRQQKHVATLGDLALRGAELADLLAEAARLAADGLDAPLAKVMEHLPGENALLIRAGVGWRDGVVGVVKMAADDDSPAGYALSTGTPVISNHLATQARFRTPALMAEHGVRRAINVVIAGDDRAFGVLEADSCEPGDFHGNDVSFMQSLAHTLGNALDRDRDRRRLEALLAEKELLMQEIHHRVRNSLQIVQSILSLQSRAINFRHDPAGVLQEAGRRVATIASVHDRLYRDGVGLQVRLPDYLAGLVADLDESLGVGAAGRSLALTSADATWPAAEVAPLGIVLAELVTNALKHGEGAVEIRFETPTDGPARLVVADGGFGPSKDFDPTISKGLGMRLIIGLLRARRGVLRLEPTPSGGQAFVAEFGPAA